MLNDEVLHGYAKQGLIPGPDESEEAFEERAAFCLNFKETLAAKLFNGWQDEGFLFLKESFAITKPLYGMTPDWVALLFSNDKLLPWHGGAAWIFQIDDQTPTCALIQLRKRLFRKKSYFGLVNRQELIAHELCHIGRMMYSEPKFEELLAYRSSGSWFSKTLGPLIESSFESGLFVFLLLMIFLFDISVFLFGDASLFFKVQWIKLIPLGLIACAVIRLIYKNKLFNSALKNLTDILENKEKANAVIYRLTDHEINHFSKAKNREIETYIMEQKELRWRSIRLMLKSN